MATVLFAWQLGGGMGHLLQMSPLAGGHAARGHRVYLAARDLGAAARACGLTGVSFLQAPAKTRGRAPYPRAVSFAQVLGNLGFGDQFELFGLACAWRNLYHAVRPDLIVFDHAPAAMLAARGLPARRAVIGSGFCCPPDVRPLPVGRSTAGLEIDPAKVLADEDWILRHVNWMLGHWRQPPIERLGRLYADVDENFLTTFPELDHYGQRAGARYWGPVSGLGGAAPQWPAAGSGPRVFAYLKRFPALPALLQALKQLGWPTLILSDGIDPATRKRFDGGSLRFEDERLDPTLVARQCDLAVLNATHGTTCDVLLAGKPVLQVPLYGEQELTAEAVTRLGAGIVVWPKNATRADFDQALERLTSDASYRSAAADFSARHADFDPERQRSEMLRRCEELLAQAASPAHTAAPASLVLPPPPFDWKVNVDAVLRPNHDSLEGCSYPA